MTPSVLPQLVANDGAYVPRAAIADPDRHACELKVDGVPGLVTFDDGRIETRNPARSPRPTPRQQVCLGCRPRLD